MSNATEFVSRTHEGVTANFHLPCAVEYGIEQGVLSPGARGLDGATLIHQATESGLIPGTVALHTEPHASVLTFRPARPCARCGTDVLDHIFESPDPTGVRYQGRTYTLAEALEFASQQGFTKPEDMSWNEAAEFARDKGYDVSLVWGYEPEPEPEGGVITFAPGEVTLDNEAGVFERHDPTHVEHNGTRYTIEEALAYAQRQGFTKPESMTWAEAADWAERRGYPVTLLWEGEPEATEPEAEGFHFEIEEESPENIEDPEQDPAADFFTALENVVQESARQQAQDLKARVLAGVVLLATEDGTPYTEGVCDLAAFILGLDEDYDLETFLATIRAVGN